MFQSDNRYTLTTNFHPQSIPLNNAGNWLMLLLTFFYYPQAITTYWNSPHLLLPNQQSGRPSLYRELVSRLCVYLVAIAAGTIGIVLLTLSYVMLYYLSFSSVHISHLNPLNLLLSIFDTALVGAILLLAIGIVFLLLSIHKNFSTMFASYISRILPVSLYAFSLSSLLVFFPETRLAEISALIGICIGGQFALSLKGILKSQGSELLKSISTYLLTTCTVLAFSLLSTFVYANRSNLENPVFENIYFELLITVSVGVSIFGFIFLRPDDWILASAFPRSNAGYGSIWTVPHVTTLPYRQVLKELEDTLEKDWQKGLHLAKQLSDYTFQRPYVDKVINKVLSQSDASDVLKRVKYLYEMDYFRGRLLNYAPKTKSAFVKHVRSRRSPFSNISEGHFKSAVMTVENKPLRQVYSLDTHVRSNIAGYLYLKQRHLDKAQEAFSKFEKGNEIDMLLQALKLCVDDNSVANAPISLPAAPEQPIYSEAWAALYKLRDAIRCIWVFRNCRYGPNRSHIGNTVLTLLIEVESELQNLFSSETYASVDPIADIIRNRAARWFRTIEREITQDTPARTTPLVEVANPFIFTEPIHNHEFLTNRDSYIKILNNAWRPGNLQPILLYGQHLIGKTSLILKAASSKHIKPKVVYINLKYLEIQTSHVQFLNTICYEVSESEFIQPPPFDTFQNNPYQTFVSFIRRVAQSTEKGGLIIALDEFDHIKSCTEPAVDNEVPLDDKPLKIQDNLLSFLWELSQTEPAIGFMFVTSRTPRELLSNLANPFSTGLNPIKVSYLHEDESSTGIKEVTNLLRYPSEDFLLYFDTSACQRINSLTNGHPYLVQLIAHCIVDRFNQSVGGNDDMAADPLISRQNVDDLLRNNNEENTIKIDFDRRLLRYVKNVGDEIKELADIDDKCVLPQLVTLLRRISCSPTGFVNSDLKSINISEAPIDEHLIEYLIYSLLEHDIIKITIVQSHPRKCISVGLLRSRLAYPIRLVKNKQMEDMHRSLLGRTTSTFPDWGTPPNFEFLVLENELDIDGFRIGIKEHSALACCSVWHKQLTDKTNYEKITVMGNLRAVDVPTATRVIESAAHKAKQNGSTSLWGVFELECFWQMRFFGLVREPFDNHFRRRNSFNEKYRYESTQVRLTSEHSYNITIGLNDLGVIVRKVNGSPKDIDSIFEVTNICFVSDPLYLEIERNRFAEMYQQVSDYASTDYILLIETVESKDIIGFLWALPLDENQKLTKEQKIGSLNIQSVAVLPKYSGKGIGRLVLKRCHQLAYSAGALSVNHEYIWRDSPFLGLSSQYGQPKTAFTVYSKRLDKDL